MFVGYSMYYTLIISKVNVFFHNIDVMNKVHEQKRFMISQLRSHAFKQA
jgi:hypothetical protein